MVNIIHRLDVSTQNFYISVPQSSINKHTIWPTVPMGTAADSYGGVQVPRSVDASGAHTKMLFGMK